MKVTLIAIPLITTLLSLYLYRFQDRKKELFNLDFVQFIYLFVMAPTMFIWLKSLLFYLLWNNPELNLSLNEMFIIDSFFSLIAMCLMAVLAIHSLTKTFWIRRYFDPKFDVFRLSEYFHLWWTHVWMWTGFILISSFLSLMNLMMPIEIHIGMVQWVFILIFALLAGFLLYFSIWMSDPKMSNFMRLMKLMLAFFFFLHALMYFFFDLVFGPELAIYWFVFFTLATSVSLASFTQNNRSLLVFRSRFLHKGWGDNKHKF